jgi:hypothetical protein
MDNILNTQDQTINSNNKFYCKYCNNIYSTKTNLINHQKTAKFCIELRNKENEENIIIKSFNCKKCNKNFTRKDTFEKHISICKIEPKLTNESELFSKLLEKIKKVDNENINLLEEVNKLKNENLVLSTSLKLKDDLIKDINKKYMDLLNKII